MDNGHKSDSFAAHFERHFNATASHTDLRKYMTFKVVKLKYPIGAMNFFKTKLQPMYGGAFNYPQKST